MTYDVTIFGLQVNINPVAFTIFGIEIYWYGILILTGFLLALLYALKNSKRFGIDNNRMLDVVIVATPAAILSARLYYVVFYGNISEFFNIRSGGLAIYGGIIGAFIAGVIMCKIRKVDILSMFDLAAIGFPIGQAIGRWGNFFNQEAFGTPTQSDWFGMESAATGYELVHPCFLYESLWCAAGFILLHILSKHRKFKGEIFLSYAAWYGFGRFFIEGLRTDSLMIGSFRVSQIVAAVSCLAAVAVLVIMFIKSKKDRLPKFMSLKGDGCGGADCSCEDISDDVIDGSLTASEYGEIIAEMEKESHSGDETEDELGENTEASLENDNPSQDPDELSGK